MFARLGLSRKCEEFVKTSNWFDVMDVASTSPQEASTSGPPLKQQVGWKVYEQRDHDQVSQKVKQTGHSVLLAEEEAPGPVHVELRTPEIIDGNHHPGGQRLAEPSSAIIAQAPNGPQQQRRSDHVKQAEQANE
jgi:hypothetical protein